MASDITWVIQPEELWDMYQANPKLFQEQIQIVCTYSFDDADKKWWLLAETDFTNSGLLLSLEDSEHVIASEMCSAAESVVSAVERLAQIGMKLQNKEALT